MTNVLLSHVKKGTDKTWLGYVFCVGNEDSLMKCRHRPWRQSNCAHNEDVVLRCTGPGVRVCKSKCPERFFNKELHASNEIRRAPLAIALQIRITTVRPATIKK